MAELSGPSLPPGTGGDPRQLVVLLHGVGADGRDLLGLAPMLARHLPHAAFHAPDAPFPCGMAAWGRQWFSLQDRSPRALLAGVEGAAPVLDGYLDALLARYDLEDGRMALVGFSQGAMMALHVAPRRPRPAAAVLGYAGALIGAARLAAEIRSRPPVLLVHGDADDVVPFPAMATAAEGLEAAGLSVRQLPRPGLPHSIDPEGIEIGARFLTDLLPG